MTTSRLLTYAQAADVLNVSTKTISRRVRAGAIDVVKDGGLRRIPADALNEYIADRTVPSRAPRRPSRRPSRRVTRPLNPVGVASGGRVRRLWEDSELNEH